MCTRTMRLSTFSTLRRDREHLCLLKIPQHIRSRLLLKSWIKIFQADIRQVRYSTYVKPFPTLHALSTWNNSIRPFDPLIQDIFYNFFLLMCFSPWEAARLGLNLSLEFKFTILNHTYRKQINRTASSALGALSTYNENF